MSEWLAFFQEQLKSIGLSTSEWLASGTAENHDVPQVPAVDDGFQYFVGAQVILSVLGLYLKSMHAVSSRAVTCCYTLCVVCWFGWT